MGDILQRTVVFAILLVALLAGLSVMGLTGIRAANDRQAVVYY